MSNTNTTLSAAYSSYYHENSTHPDQLYEAYRRYKTEAKDNWQEQHIYKAKLNEAGFLVLKEDLPPFGLFCSLSAEEAQDSLRHVYNTTSLKWYQEQADWRVVRSAAFACNIIAMAWCTRDQETRSAFCLKPSQTPNLFLTRLPIRLDAEIRSANAAQPPWYDLGFRNGPQTLPKGTELTFDYAGGYEAEPEHYEHYNPLLRFPMKENVNIIMEDLQYLRHQHREHRGQAVHLNAYQFYTTRTKNTAGRIQLCARQDIPDGHFLFVYGGVIVSRNAGGSKRPFTCELDGTMDSWRHGTEGRPQLSFVDKNSEAINCAFYVVKLRVPTRYILVVASCNAIPANEPLYIRSGMLSSEAIALPEDILQNLADETQVSQLWATRYQNYLLNSQSPPHIEAERPSVEEMSVGPIAEMKFNTSTEDNKSESESESESEDEEQVRAEIQEMLDRILSIPERPMSRLMQSRGVLPQQ